MPEQQSQRAVPITAAPLDAPFETQLVRFGQKGLNLNDELDVLDAGAFTRLTNADHDANGSVTGRAGQTSFATATGTHHSVRKFRDPQAGTTSRVWGVGSNLHVGASGALSAAVDSGYSGDPLALVPHRPPLSGDSWMFVGDRLRMRKVRADGLDLPIGLPAPGAAVSAALATEYRTTVAEFETADGTQASAWTGNAGKDEDGHPSGVPITEDSVVTPLGVGSAVRFRTTVGNAVGAYDNYWGMALSRDLTQLTPVGGGGTIAASDDDFLHFWSFLSLPHLIQELRIYFVISASFDPTVLPGTSTAGVNGDAYVKGFRQDDFAQFIRGAQAQIDAAETARARALRDQDLLDRKDALLGTGTREDVRSTWAELRAATDPGRRLSLQSSSGSYQWTEFGTIGVALRRGDFARIGATTGRSWATVTGIIVYVRMDQDAVDSVGVIGLDDMYLTGGRGPDTADPGQQQYDYRVTHYDPRTGAESNGSPEMAVANRLDSLRRRITVTPAAAFGDAAMRQRVYRRGGSLISNWFFLGANTSDGGAFNDDAADDAISAAGTLPINHFQPVPTVDENGATILAQAVPALWGPVEGMLFACGDPYRPGHVYHCVPDQPDHWASDGLTEVCPPSEELMNGGLLGHQAFVLSRLRLYMLYPNLTGTGVVTSAPTLCKRGLWSRWGMAIGPKGVYFVSEDGIFVSSGGPEEWISRDLDPLFRGETRHGYLPINKTDTASIRLTIWENKLYFQYADTGGAKQVMVYSLLHEFWRHYDFGIDPANLQGEDEEILLIGGANTTYQHTGTSDNGTAIATTLRLGAFTGGRREEKLFGDMIVDADRQGVNLTVTNYLNEEAVTNAAQTIDGGTGRKRYVADAFGLVPQRAHSISTEISWSTTAAPPVIYQLGYAVALQPEITSNRVTQWDDLGHPDEKWVTGVTFDVDTANVARTIIVERDYAGQRTTIDTLTVQTDGRHKVSFSWAAVPAQQVRVRPTGDCEFWVLYRADWIWQPEPPRISKWDIHFENQWDAYYTGLDLYCDTLGVEKRIEIFVDETQLTNALGGNLSYWPVTANGRRVVHLTLPWGRGHVFRFRAIDANPGILYTHRWHLQQEPSEQANWNQNFSVYGTRADKWLKAIVFECDTFNQAKQVGVEVDGTTVETLSVQANGRRVVQIALATQRLGRVWRMFPTDGNPGRLYSAQPIFDEEPFQLTRWETQETNHNLPGWFYPLYGHLTLKSTAEVTLAVSLQINQRGTVVTEEYKIPSTAGQKIRHFQSFKTDRGGKGVLIKYVLTSSAAFYLYREETSIAIQPWGAAEPIVVQPFGSDDLDPTRPMKHAVLAAEVPGGSLGD